MMPPRLRLRWLLPLANAALDLSLATLVPASIAARIELLVAGTLPAGVFSWTLLWASPSIGLRLHVGLAMLIWYAIGAAANERRPRARRLCLIFLGLRAVTLAMAPVPSMANGAALVLACLWLSAALAVARQAIAVGFRRTFG